MRDKSKIIFSASIIFSLLFLSLVSASTIVSFPSPVMVVLNSAAATQIIEFQNTNTSLTQTVTLTISSSLSSIIQVSTNPLSVANLASTTISVKSGVTSGTYSGTITYSSTDGSTGSIPVSVTLASTTPAPIANCNLDIFPTILTNVKIAQGATKTRNIQLTIPNCYSSYVNVQGISMSTDEKPIQLGEISLGNIQPGNSVMIPIDINSADVATGTYQDTLSFLLYNSSGSRIDVPTVSISVLVTTGISPMANFSITEFPSCSLSAIQLTTNSTYRLTCTNANPNIDIMPIVDKTMIKGVNVVKSGGQYIYEFQPLKVGTTTISAQFLYQLSSIGSGFESEVRITSGGVVTSGTNISFEYTPKLSNAKDGDTIIVHALDTKTNSYLQNAKIFLDGILINGSFLVRAQTNYSIRAEENGYLPGIENVFINPQYIAITTNPASGFIEGSTISVTTNPVNCSIYLDGAQVSSSFTTSMGNHTIKVSHEGFQDTNLNIYAEEAVNFNSHPEQKDLKKGTQLIYNLNKNATCEVDYSASPTSQFTPMAPASFSNQIVFTPDKSGTYHVLVNGIVRDSFDIKGWDGKFLGLKWYWDLLIVIGIVGLIIFIGSRSPSSSSYLPRSLSGMAEVTTEV